MSGTEKQQVVPRLRPFVVGEEPTPRTGVWAEVYAQLHGLSREDPPRGAFVPFGTASGGHKAIQRMQVWASEDGLQVVYATHRDGGRNVYLRPYQEEEQ